MDMFRLDRLIENYSTYDPKSTHGQAHAAMREAAARIRDLEAENARLNDRLFVLSRERTAAHELADKERWRYQDEHGVWLATRDANIQMTAELKALSTALALAVDEVDAARQYEPGPDTCRRGVAWIEARAATDANELIRQYRASKEQTR